MAYREEGLRFSQARPPLQYVLHYQLTHAETLGGNTAGSLSKPAMLGHPNSDHIGGCREVGLSSEVKNVTERT